MTRPIQMVDLQSQYTRLKGELDTAIQEVLVEAQFIKGRHYFTFIEELAAWQEARHVVGCANGTDALQVALMALGLKAGDEVLVPAFTYAAAAEVIALLGLTPVMVDVDPLTFNLDPAQLEAARSPRTRAIIPVHLFGQSADMEPILNFARQHNLYVVEDNAQSIGAQYTFSDGTTRYTGNMGQIGTTSFFPSKNLGCYGDGGAVFTHDKDLAQALEAIANHGQYSKYRHDRIGVNSRLDTLQAAILRIKLRHLNGFIQARQQLADRYDEALGSLPLLRIPYRSPQSTHVFHQYTLIVGGGLRDELKAYLQAKQIPTMVYYPIPLHRQEAYKRKNLENSGFPAAEQLCRSVLSLPMHTEMEPDQIEMICNTILSFNRIYA